MISAKNIFKSYGDNIVLKDLSCSFTKNGLYWIKGDSGSGKTTLLNILSGRLKDYSGEVKCSGETFFLSYENYLIDNFSVKETIEFHKSLNLNFKDYENRFGIEKFFYKKIKRLSGGEKQKLGIYLALSMNSENILLDEPFSGVDNESKKEIINELKKVSKDKIIIITSHQKIDGCKRVVLENGRLDRYNVFKNIVCEDRKIKKVNLNKWALKLHGKQWISRVVFIISILSIDISNMVIHSKIDSIKDELDNVVYSNEIYYKEGGAKLNKETFYDKVVKSVAKYLDDYFFNVYSPEMIDDKVYVSNMFIGDVSIFSNIISDYSLKESEIVLETNLIDFCNNNKYYYCNEVQVREELVGSYLELDLEEEKIVYKVVDVIFSDNEGIYVFDKVGLIDRLEKHYEKIYYDYYLVVKSDRIDKFYENINSNENLLEYDCYLLSDNGNQAYFLIKEIEWRYFSFEEINQTGVIACSDVGYSCNSLNFSSLKSLVYIDDINVDGDIKYIKDDYVSEYDEIVISSGLANLINKKPGDNIDLSFYIEGEYYLLDDVYIKDIIENEEYVIYHKYYDFNLYKDMFNKHIRIRYIDGVNLAYKKITPLDYEIMDEGMSYFNDITYWINVVMIIFTIIGFSVLFAIEGNKLKKHNQVFRCVSYNGVDHMPMLNTYLLAYLSGVLMFVFNIYVALIYFGIFYLFWFICVKKIKSRITWI